MLPPPQFRKDDDCLRLGEKILPKKEEQVCKFREFETKNYDLPKHKITVGQVREYFFTFEYSKYDNWYNETAWE